MISKYQQKIDLLKIQDISCGVRGLLRRIVGAGFIEFETAGSSSNIDFFPVANYQSIVDKVGELIDAAKKREQMEMAKSISQGIKSREPSE